MVPTYFVPTIAIIDGSGNLWYYVEDCIRFYGDEDRENRNPMRFGDVYDPDTCAKLKENAEGDDALVVDQSTLVRWICASTTFAALLVRDWFHKQEEVQTAYQMYCEESKSEMDPYYESVLDMFKAEYQVDR